MGTQTKKKRIDIEKMRKEMKAEMDQFKDCNFEEFKEGFVDFSKQMIDFQILLLEELAKGQTELMMMAAAAIKASNEANNKDFKIAEKNFKMVDKQFDAFNEKLSQIAAAAVVSLVRSIGVSQRLFQTGKLDGEISESEIMDLLPIKAKMFIASVMDMKVKELESIIKNYAKAA